jgi:L-ribulose-5-phosphate 3-epimerase
MPTLNRRTFVQFAGAAGIATALPRGVAAASLGKPPIELGVTVWVAKGETAETAVARVHDLALPTCQIGFNDLASRPAAGSPLKAALQKYGIRATAVMELGPGPMVWNFYGGPQTIGLVPPGTRAARIAALKRAADLAEACGIPAIHTHCGFIPENPNDPLYPQAVAAVREVAAYCKQRGRMFLCETGQETPITLLRMIRDTGQDNLFVNLDLANLILYDKGNPLDALDVIGPLVRGLHAKDGKFPTNPKDLGKEVPIGQGKVNFREVLKKLKALSYQGPMTIEREIKGPQQTADILKSKSYLTKLIAETYA